MAVNFSLNVSEDGNGTITVTENGRVRMYSRSDPMFKLYVGLMRERLLEEAGDDGAIYIDKLFASLNDDNT
jgi:hypothetical protein